FYNHFESKEALVLAVLTWRDQTWGERMRALLRDKAGDHPRAQLLALFEVLDEVWGTEGYHGCLFARAGAEFPLQHDPIHVVVETHVGSVVTAIRELAGYAGAHDPEALAQELLIVAAGAYALSQLQDPQ